MTVIRRLSDAACVEDLRQLAHRAVPKNFMDYYEAGSYSESTLNANRRALEAIELRQRVLADIGQGNLKTELLGEQITIPAAIARIGMMGMAWRDGEIAAARAASAFGVPFTLSTMSRYVRLRMSRRLSISHSGFSFM